MKLHIKYYASHSTSRFIEPILGYKVSLIYTISYLQDQSEVDPLEAFMEGVSNEIKAENKQTNIVKKVKKVVKVSPCLSFLISLPLFYTGMSLYWLTIC